MVLLFLTRAVFFGGLKTEGGRPRPSLLPDSFYPGCRSWVHAFSINLIVHSTSGSLMQSSSSQLPSLLDSYVKEHFGWMLTRSTRSGIAAPL
jgi:hypothetical protein